MLKHSAMFEEKFFLHMLYPLKSTHTGVRHTHTKYFLRDHLRNICKKREACVSKIPPPLCYVSSLLPIERKEEFLNVASFECRRKLRVISPKLGCFCCIKTQHCCCWQKVRMSYFQLGQDAKQLLPWLAGRCDFTHTVAVLLDSQR